MIRRFAHLALLLALAIGACSMVVFFDDRNPQVALCALAAWCCFLVAIAKARDRDGLVCAHDSNVKLLPVGRPELVRRPHSAISEECGLYGGATRRQFVGDECPRHDV